MAVWRGFKIIEISVRVLFEKLKKSKWILSFKRFYISVFSNFCFRFFHVKIPSASEKVFPLCPVAFLSRFRVKIPSAPEKVFPRCPFVYFLLFSHFKSSSAPASVFPFLISSKILFSRFHTSSERRAISYAFSLGTTTTPLSSPTI